MATNKGGWSDDSSLCGFIVDDNASLEIMTDSGNEYLSSGETFAEVLQEPHTATSTTSSMLGTERGGVDREKVLKTIGLLRGEVSVPSVQAPEHQSENGNQASSESHQTLAPFSDPSSTNAKIR
ncbi:hypothetical protein K439DRAFT_1618205 [Ramaria rubella]|nr:hypothetical protein K439DRAFT_1618205 [Ramaria rubella]